VDAVHPFRLATSPSRSFLNTTFNETPSSQAREGAPTVMIHPDDAAMLDVGDGDAVTLGNMRGETTLTARLFNGVHRGRYIRTRLISAAMVSTCSLAPKPLRPWGARRSMTTRSGPRRLCPRFRRLDAVNHPCGRVFARFCQAECRLRRSVAAIAKRHQAGNCTRWHWRFTTPTRDDC
jgi:hypothetical protein